MAEKRMFTKKITCDERFYSMPSSTQALYFHMNMMADDDGFCNCYSMCKLMSHASEDDLRVLISKKFVIPFESGIVVIKHWRLHNILRKDRYLETTFKNEKELLSLDENGSYSMHNGNQLVTNWQPNGNQMAPQYRIDKISIDNTMSHAKGETLSKPNLKPNKTSIAKPTLDEVKEYLTSRGSSVDAEKFFYHYEANGWVQGKGKPIKNWKACVITWEKRGADAFSKKKTEIVEPDYMKKETSFSNVELTEEEKALYADVFL